MQFHKEFCEVKGKLERIGFDVLLPLYVDELSRGEINKTHTDQKKRF